MAWHGDKSVAEEYSRIYQIAVKGHEMTEVTAQAMEQESAAHPENLDLRVSLLGYYLTRHSCVGADNTARNAHIFWLIANCPESPIAEGGYTGLDTVSDAAAYPRAKVLWLDQIAKQPQNIAILSHAARFFTLSDRELADELGARLQRLEPDNPQWPHYRGHIAALAVGRKTGAEIAAKAEKALIHFRQALALEPESNFRGRVLQDAAKMAFAAQHYEEAKQYADELRDYGSRLPRKEAGDALHHSNTILGRLALHFNQREEAKAHLLASGDVAASPVLGSFGPNMTLAMELLEAGETETVLQYLDLCGVFWQREKLTEWREQIGRGEAPDFGSNLRY